MARAVLRILLHGQSGSSQASSTEPCTTEDVSPLLTEGLATTTSTTLRLTQQFLTMTMTWSPWRVASLNPYSHRVSCCSVCPRGVRVSLEADNGFPTK